MHRLVIPVAYVAAIAFVSLQIDANVCQKLCICDKNGFVNCSRNELTQVPSDIPLNTTNLDLSINNLTYIHASAFRQLLNLTIISLAENNLGDDGIQPGALNLPKLVNIDISYTNMSSFPSVVLPSTLKKLYFIQNIVNTIRPDSFENIPLLEYLDLSNNNLNAIPFDLFRSLPNLMTLYIPFNKFRNDGIPDEAFVSNEKLSLFSARFNQLDHVLPNLPSSLKVLDYAGNNIKTIPSYAFKSTPNITSLALWNGNIKTLEDNAFGGLPKLQYLDMMQNNISSNITNTTFAGLVGLQILYIDLNNVSYIDPLAFQAFGNVGSLWLSDNKLSTLDPRVFDRKFMPHLFEVYIDGNPWYCDCRLKWLKEISEHPTFTIQDPHLIVCSGPPPLKDRAWDTLESKEFVCR